MPDLTVESFLWSSGNPPPPLDDLVETSVDPVSIKDEDADSASSSHRPPICDAVTAPVPEPLSSPSSLTSSASTSASSAMVRVYNPPPALPSSSSGSGQQAGDFNVGFHNGSRVIRFIVVII